MLKGLRELMLPGITISEKQRALNIQCQCLFGGKPARNRGSYREAAHVTPLIALRDHTEQRGLGHAVSSMTDRAGNDGR